MRRIAAGSLFPALIPAVTKSGATVDINAHLGGCLAGAAIAFVMLIAWNDEVETPPARSIAAAVSRPVGGDDGLGLRRLRQHLRAICAVPVWI